MRLFILLFPFCFSLPTFLHGQGPVDNVFVYAEQSGTNTGNSAILGRNSDGSVIFWPYQGQIQILGTNSTRPYPIPASIKIQTANFFRTGENREWVISGSHAYHISNNVIIDSLDAGGEILQSTADTGRGSVLWFTYRGGSSIRVAYYKQKKVIRLGESPFKITEYHTLITLKDGRVFLGTVSRYCWLDESGFGTVQTTSIPEKKYFILGSHNQMNNILVKSIDAPVQLARFDGKDLRFILPGRNLNEVSHFSDTLAVLNHKDGKKEIIQFSDSTENTVGSFYHPDQVRSLIFASPGSYYLGGTGKIVRAFNYLKKYPNLYGTDNSDAIVTIQQDSEGAIWAGSYKNHLAIITPSGINRTPLTNHRFTNGGAVIGDDVYLIDENPNYGLLRIGPGLKVQSLTSGISGFFTFADHEKKKFYLGTAGNGLWMADYPSLLNNKPEWKVANQRQSITLPNIVSIVRDSANRIWMGQPSRGWAVYYPEADSGKTFLIDKKQTTFGYFCSYVDEDGNVWMGTKQQGLVYYPAKEKGRIDPSKIEAIPHPLLQIKKPITSMLRVREWLILSATDKILAFNIAQWNKHKKAIVKYLSPVEAALEGETEQNTMLLDKRDQTVWFSTSEMLYHWDVERWSNLPTQRVEPFVQVAIKDSLFTLGDHELNLDPLSNNIDFSVLLQSSNNLPVFMSAALIRDGDTVHMPEPSLTNRFNYTNLAIGSYRFQLTICQPDGTVDIREYPIRINGFLWQRWWFWLIASSVVIGIATLLINQRKRSQVAEQKAKAKEAELAAFKTENEKLLANMQIVTLINQFRPHFILNALNTIGAQMFDNPGAESVLSRLGESINIIFNHAQKNRIAHPFKDEWQLVTNIIEIHKIMYLTGLDAKLPTDEELQAFNHIKLPLGIIQIPVENSLLHGLGNKPEQPWQLSISVSRDQEYLRLTITDNGVGRKKAASLSNYRKHGAGTRNLDGVIHILNQRNTKKILITYSDLDPISETGDTGTVVTIRVPILFNYDA